MEPDFNLKHMYSAKCACYAHYVFKCEKDHSICRDRVAGHIDIRSQV